jgi:hypothetical protein
MEHARPDTASDDAVAAAGKMTEALETLERARGHLYSFHQLIGSTDLALDDVLEPLRGENPALADEIESELIGRNVLEGRWTFQIIEEFEALYYDVFRDYERRVREALVDGRKHVYEAEMKARRRS